jgi:hypothetical protein
MQLKLEIKDSGPQKVAHFDCHEFKGPYTLGNPKCRAEVLEQLCTEGEVDYVVLEGPVTRIYCSPEISALARTIATARQLALDRAMYGGTEGKKCERCKEERISLLLGAIDEITKYPHGFGILDDIAGRASKDARGACKKCTREHFAKLAVSMKNLFRELGFLKRLKPENYDEVFVMRQKPFFVEGVWHPPPRGSRLLETYELTDNRGTVKITSRPISQFSSTSSIYPSSSYLPDT